VAKNSEIADHLRQLDAVISRAEALLHQLDDEGVNWRPKSGAWSIAQCLDHLNITGQRYLSTMKTVVDQAAKSGPYSSSPGKRRFLARFFIWALEPPSRIKAKAPAAFAPGAELQLDALRQAHTQTHSDLRSLIEAADGVSLDQVKVLSPVSDKISFRIGEAFAVILAHERRHLAQAEQVLAEMKTS